MLREPAPPIAPRLPAAVPGPVSGGLPGSHRRLREDDPAVRLTLSIPDDLFRELRRRARAEGVSASRLVEECLRAGLAVDETNRPLVPAFDLGKPSVNLDRALRLAAEMEDEEILRKMDAGR